MKKTKVSGIYKGTNKINGKIYIGQSIDIYKRWNHHIHCSFNENVKDHTSPFHNAIRKYGKDNFAFEILEIVGDYENLNEKEIMYIDKFNSYIHSDKSNGYNATLGGGVDTSEENRLKISKSREYKYGKDNKVSKPVIFDGKEYGSTLDLCNDFGFDKNKITSYLSKSRNMPVEFYVLGLRYKYENMSEYNRGRKVNEEDYRVWLDGKMFNSSKDCSIYCNIPDRTIRNWLYGNRKMPKEFYDRGLRYNYREMSFYKYQDGNVNPVSNGNNCRFPVKLYCDNKIFNSKKQFSDYYNVPYSTVTEWIDKDNINKRFKELGLKKICDEEEVELIKNNKAFYV